MKAVDAKFVQRNAAFLLDTLLSLVGIILLTLYFLGEKNPLYSVIILYDPLQKYFYYMKNQKYGRKIGLTFISTVQSRLKAENLQNF